MFREYYEALFGFKCPFSNETIDRLVMLSKGNAADAVITYDREVGSSIVMGSAIYGKGKLVWDLIQSASEPVRMRVMAVHGGRTTTLYSKIVAPEWNPPRTNTPDKQMIERDAKKLLKLQKKCAQAGK